jgi:3-methyladenine DNA glycosylase AlkD
MKQIHSIREELSMDCAEILAELQRRADPQTVKSMTRFGVPSDGMLGVQVSTVRELAKEVGKSHSLAAELWNTGVYEARILATLVDVPAEVTEEQMEQWVKDFDSWAICDGCCNNLFVRTVYAHQKAVQWSSRRHEYVKRAGFTLIAVLAVHDKKTPDAHFLPYFPIILRECDDDRNFVRKAVNWALRQLGKRSVLLNSQAIATAQQIRKVGTRSAEWIANDALRELESERVQERLRKRAEKEQKKRRSK